MRVEGWREDLGGEFLLQQAARRGVAERTEQGDEDRSRNAHVGTSGGGENWRRPWRY